MIRLVAKIFAVTVALTAFLPVGPLFAASAVAWVSGTGSDANPCTASQPCATFVAALEALSGAGVINGQISCLNSPGPSESAVQFSGSLTVDCAGLFDGVSTIAAFLLVGTNQTVRVRNLTISGSLGGISAIKVTGSGTLIIENCVFENMVGTALDIEPNGPFNLVITNSRMSNSGSGVLLRPLIGGSVTATFSGVTIANNNGGGLKTDTTNGPLSVSVDISNSTIINNAGNGMNAVSTFVGTNMLNIRNSVIARNGSAGVQANGTNSAALVNNTLLDSNAAGATTAVGGGRILTYGNNSVVGSPGSGFTGPAALQ